MVERTLTAEDDWRSTAPAVAVMEVLLPDPLTQWAAVSTMVWL